MAGFHDMTEDELVDYLHAEAAVRGCELRVRPMEDEIRAALFSPNDPHAPDQEMVEAAYGPDRRAALAALAELLVD